MSKVQVINIGSSSIKDAHFENGTKVATDSKIDYNQDTFIIRVVHSGPHFKESTLITEENLPLLKETIDLAPLHNPSSIKLIEELLSKGKKVYAAFDTTYHLSIPEVNSLYAIPKKYRDQGIKKYGAHGWAHQYAQKVIGPKANMINVHLGSGSSITLIKDGKSNDTTMGLTPLAGLVMATRSGSIDPAVVQAMMKMNNLSIDETIKVLNEESGLKALTNNTNVTEILESETSKDEFGIKVLNRSIVDHLVAYINRLDNIDAITFTGGIAEHNHNLVKEILSNVKVLKLSLDEDSAIPVKILEVDEQQMMYESVFDNKG